METTRLVSASCHDRPHRTADPVPAPRRGALRGQHRPDGGMVPRGGGVPPAAHQDLEVPPGGAEAARRRGGGLHLLDADRGDGTRRGRPHRTAVGPPAGRGGQGRLRRGRRGPLGGDAARRLARGGPPPLRRGGPPRHHGRPVPRHRHRPAPHRCRPGPCGRGRPGEGRTAGSARGRGPHARGAAERPRDRPFGSGGSRSRGGPGARRRRRTPERGRVDGRPSWSRSARPRA